MRGWATVARRTTPRLSEAAAEYVGQLKRQGKSRGMVYSAKSLLSRLADSQKDCQTGSLTPARIEDFFYGLNGLAVTCEKATLGKYRNEMKQFLGWCHRRDYNTRTADFLLQGISEKSTKNKKKRFRFTTDELAHLMECATDPRDRALIAFVANTGVRISEALSMTFQDVSLKLGQLILTIHKSNGKQVRLNMTPMLERELRAWLTVYAAMHGPAEDSWYLFPAKPSARFRRVPGEIRPRPVQAPGYVPSKPVTVPATIIKMIGLSAGFDLPAGEAWHIVRRSSATLLFEKANKTNGRDSAMRMVQAFLNHEQMSTTEGYLDLEVERQRLNALLSAEDFLAVETGNVVPLTRAEAR